MPNEIEFRNNRMKKIEKHIEKNKNNKNPRVQMHIDSEKQHLSLARNLIYSRPRNAIEHMDIATHSMARVDKIKRRGGK